jgi:uncharacterized protein with GYD domain
MLFCITANYTPQALTAMREKPSSRVEAIEQLLAAAGGKLVSMYGTIAEGPGVLAIIDVDPAVAPSIVGVVTSAGTIHNVRLQRLLSQDELVGVRQKAWELRGSYKAPGQ